MAPEVINGYLYDQKADVWSLGTLLFQILTGEYPFHGKDLKELKQNLKLGVYKIPKQTVVSPECMDFLNCCLRLDSAKRKTWAELLSHPFLLNLRSIDKAAPNRKSVHIDIRQTVNFQEHFNNHLIQKIEKRIKRFKKLKEGQEQNQLGRVPERRVPEVSTEESEDSQYESELGGLFLISSLCIVMLLILVSLLWNL